MENYNIPFSEPVTTANRLREVFSSSQSQLPQRNHYNELDHLVEETQLVS